MGKKIDRQTRIKKKIQIRMKNSVSAMEMKGLYNVHVQCTISEWK